MPKPVDRFVVESRLKTVDLPTEPVAHPRQSIGFVCISQKSRVREAADISDACLRHSVHQLPDIRPLRRWIVDVEVDPVSLAELVYKSSDIWMVVVAD